MLSCLRGYHGNKALAAMCNRQNRCKMRRTERMMSADTNYDDDDDNGVDGDDRM